MQEIRVMDKNDWYTKKLGVKNIQDLENFKNFLIALSATCGGRSTISFTTVISAPIGIASASFTLIFSLTTGIFKTLLSIPRGKRKAMIKYLFFLKVN